jgi:ATP-dependent DNA ligase
MAECRWLKPQLVAQIEYADWTDVNHLRHSKFIALRDDKPVKHVRRERLIALIDLADKHFSRITYTHLK